MSVEVVIPSPGESITEVTLGQWLCNDGDWVAQDDNLVEIESDKVTLEIPAPASGVLRITAEAGAEMEVGDIVATIDTDATAPSGDQGSDVQAADPGDSGPASVVEAATAAAAEETPRPTSMAAKVAADAGVDVNSVTGTGAHGRVTKADVLAASMPVPTTPNRPSEPAESVTQPLAIDATGTRGVRREKMSRLRARIAERLVEAQQTAAMLTTFNEVDMSEVMRLRKLHKEAFAERHGVGLGFMSFFVKACCEALRRHEGINAYIDGQEVEYHDYCDVSVAVGTPKGLVVPVLRNADRLSFAEIERGIKDLAIRARDGQLGMEEMLGGTFTISNGGVYGSLMSTPILNPPQSGILGMHKIMNRAVEDPKNPGQIVLRPMMYLALSYDHRIVDGEQAVRFLVDVKEALENPERMLLQL